MAAKSEGGNYKPSGASRKGTSRSAVRKARRNRQKARNAPQRPSGQPDVYGAPLPLPQIDRNAQAMADARYAAPLGQNALQTRQTPAWFDQYRASLQTPQQVQAAYQPAIQQSQQNAQATGQTLGLQGSAGEQDQLAAKAREALANLGTSVLTNAQAADTSYYQGRQGVAQAAQIGAMGQLGQQRQTLLGEKAAYRQQARTEGIQNERQYGLNLQHQANENKAFGLDVYKAQADAATDQAKIKADAKKRRTDARAKGQEVNKYGYTNEQWGRFSPSHRQRIMRDQAASGKTPAASKPAYTPSQHLAARKSLRTAVALVQTEAKKPANHKPDFWAKAYEALVTNKNVDPAIARAAIQLVRRGRVGGNTRQTLKDDYGITKFPKSARRKRKPGTSSGGGGGPEGTGQTSYKVLNPDRDTGGAEWRAGYERWRRKRWQKMGQGPTRRQVV